MSFPNTQSHNPDVLSCIANLSNDEVFTPPHIAIAMLDQLEQAWAEAHDGENIWSNPEVTFLDPFTKTGIFLREITSRLNKGLAVKFPDRQERINHILTKPGLWYWNYPSDGFACQAFCLLFQVC